MLDEADTDEVTWAVGVAGAVLGPATTVGGVMPPMLLFLRATLAVAGALPPPVRCLHFTELLGLIVFRPRNLMACNGRRYLQSVFSEKKNEDMRET